jgi:hypothetical protein
MLAIDGGGSASAVYGMADPTPANGCAQRRPRRQRFVRGRAMPWGVTVALALALAGCGGGQMTFDKAGWAAERGNYAGESRRGAMVTQLDHAGVVVGATRASVRALLGEPDSTGPAADIYFLGRSATGPSFETYRIEYSADGKVRAARVQRS